ncbi:cytidyltransferase [Thermoflavimicrobium daqui]|nr:cytidyltransferase [Thermoflavimicrobium daqui]
MEVIHLSHPVELEINPKCSCVMALGFFDGVHIAHQSLINRAAWIARTEKLNFSVMTFYPHPRQVVDHLLQPMKYLTPLRIKEQIFSRMGVDQLYIVQFNENIATLSSCDFVKEYLIRLQVKHVVAGFDYRYGYRGKGNIETLRREGAGFFKVHEVRKLSHKYQKISSTVIRQLVSEGFVDIVPKYLGKHYEIMGIKISQNVFYVAEPFLLPKSGVYLTKIDTVDQSFFEFCRIFESGEIVIINRPEVAKVHDEVSFHWLKRIESTLPASVGCS